ncbi:FtsX-like permease family protein [Kineosporia babensis]|uniref:ABC3 transporter permease C-terminal domain-containing protein n=1 Tax=Kineosporia babensis TaxID=499548 RepID=A0A9X1SSS6_9ACTN|nr:FtsX-like permease family protein [Kineosporia babensis]MCD5310992.1 hypothetical protein [Kineosporia babensis]
MPRLGLHLPSIRGRAWAERGPLLLIVAVVALITLVASAVPVLMPRVGTDAARDALERAGSRADLVITAPFEPVEATLGGEKIRPASGGDQSMEKAETVLGEDLSPHVRAPQSVVTTSELSVGGFGPGRVLFFSYLDTPQGEPEVTWTQGAAPGAWKPAGFVLRKGEAATVEVGLSEATARELKVAPGDFIAAVDRSSHTVNVLVSGIFRPVAPSDPAWAAGAKLLQPVTGADRVEITGLLSAESLPDARIALADQDIRRTITFPLDPAHVTWAGLDTLAADVARRKTSFNPISTGWESNYGFQSGLDRVLNTVHHEGRAAAEQARVLLIGLIVTAAAILLLTGELLARRRSRVLANARRRGASLTLLGAELILESALVTALGVALGLLASIVLVGDYIWTGALPAAAVALAGPPLLGLSAVSRLTTTRRSPANRSARAVLARTTLLRRIAVEVAVVLAAVAAFTALRQRGLVASDPEDTGGGLLTAMAPALGAVVAALILVHLMPVLLRLGLRAASRTRGSLFLLAAARAVSTAARPLPLTVLVLVSAMLTFSLTLAATTQAGQEEGALRSVGADARLDLVSAISPAEEIASREGVSAAVAALVVDSVKVSTIETWSSLHLIAVDPAAFQKLHGTSELPSLEASDGALPVLLANTDPGLRSGKPLTLATNGIQIPITDAGTAPAIGSDGEGFLIVDLAAYTAVMAEQDTEVRPNTVWVNGPGAGPALTDVVGDRGEVTTRAEVLQERRQAPLNVGVLGLAHACAFVLILLGILGVALTTAITAPARAQTHSRLSTLGLRRRESRRITLGELLPPVLLGSLGGVPAGIVLAQTSFAGLALRLLTGQAGEPSVVVPWLGLTALLVLVATVALTAWVESARRRQLRLGEALRAGEAS